MNCNKMFYIIVILLAIRSSRLKMLPLHWQFVVNPLGWNLLKYAILMSIFAAPKLCYFVEIYHKYQHYLTNVLHLNDITHFTILHTKLHHLKHMSRNYATTCNEQCCPEGAFASWQIVGDYLWVDCGVSNQKSLNFLRATTPCSHIFNGRCV